MKGVESATGSRWLTLGAASRWLGIDASTLRVWADAGRVRTFRTPGGHRRFARADLRGLLRDGRSPRPLQVARRLRRQGQSLARARTDRRAAWYAALDPPTRAAVGQTCRGLMRALAAYLAGGVRRRAHARAGEAAGRRLGEALATRDLTPAQAAEAFLHFRGVITDALTTRLALPPADQLRALRQVEAFLARVMVTMLEAFPPAAQRSRGQV